MQLFVDLVQLGNHDWLLASYKKCHKPASIKPTLYRISPEYSSELNCLALTSNKRDRKRIKIMFQMFQPYFFLLLSLVITVVALNRNIISVDIFNCLLNHSRLLYCLYRHVLGSTVLLVPNGYCIGINYIGIIMISIWYSLWEAYQCAYISAHISKLVSV